MGKKTSTVDKAMDVKEDIHIIFDKNVKHDPYLKLSARNALIKRGYEPDGNGVLKFQYDQFLKRTGKIGLEEVVVLCKCFEPDTQQTIYNHIEELKEVVRKEEKKEKISNILLTATSVFFIIMAMYGTYIFFANVIKYIIGILTTGGTV